MQSIRTFADAESGAVAVDWVVLTATLVGLGIWVAVMMGSSVHSGTTGLQVTLERDDIICNDFCDRHTPSGPAPVTGP